MTLSEYGKVLDRVMPFEASWIAADQKYIYLFRRKPVLRELTKRTVRWEDASLNEPLLKMKRTLGFPDLSEYIGFDGEIDWFIVCEPIGTSTTS